MKIGKAIEFMMGLFICAKGHIVMSILTSTVLATILATIRTHIQAQPSLIPTLTVGVLTGVAVIFITVDCFTGLIKSSKKGLPFTSASGGVTLGKYLGVGMFGGVGVLMMLLISQGYIMQVLVYIPLILTCLNEFVSIGENLEEIFGKKSSIFNIVDKIIGTLETKLIAKIGDAVDKI